MQQVLRRITHFLRRIIAPAQGEGAVRLSCDFPIATDNCLKITMPVKIIIEFTVADLMFLELIESVIIFL